MLAPPGGSYNAGDELTFQIKFNSSVTVTGQPTVSLVIGRTTIPAPYVGGSGTNALSFRHVVAAGENDADGIQVAKVISLTSGATIIDTATGQPAGLAIGPPSTAKVLVDTVAPSVISVTGPAGKTYATGQTLSFTVNFSENVVVTGSPTLPVTIGNTARNAVWNGKGDGSKSLVFTTTVKQGDSAALGLQTTGAIGLPDGAAIRDRAANDASPLVAGQFPRAKVDGVPPRAMTFGAVEIDSKTKLVSLQVTFSESVTVAGATKPFIPFTLNDTQKQLVYSAGAGKNTLTFSYRPSKGETPTLQNVSVLARAIALPAKSAIVDGAGNAAISLSAPAETTLSAMSLAENNAIGAIVGSLETTDPDTGDAFVYSLVPGTGSADNGSFSIEGNSLKAAEVFNRELKSGYSIRIRTTDSGGLSSDNVFTIVVTDVNEPPTGVSLQNAASSLPESTSTTSRIKLADISVTDDAIGMNSITLSGADAAQFEVAGTSLYLKAGVTLDFETQPTLAVKVNVSDATAVGGSQRTADYSLSITDANDLAPVFTSTAAGSIAENAGVATTVYAAAVADADGTAVNRAVSFSIKPTVGDASLVRIDSQTGAVTLKASADYETKSSYTFTVVATNTATPALFAEQVVIVAVTNVPEIALSAPADAIYREADTITFVVTFDRDVTLVGSAVLSIDVGGATRTLTLAAADRTGAASTLTFTYVVRAGDSDSNGPQVLGLALTDGSTLKDAGNPAVEMQLTLPAVGLAGIRVDAVTQVGTIVHFDTNVADFDVVLFDTALPVTVENFLSYVSAGAYSTTLIHRSTTYNPAGIQVVQGGGFSLSGNQLVAVTTDPPIVLEAGSGANARGTIAMARGAALNSATSQFFFNVQDNPGLDGNYVVFGAVVGAAGMAALDALGAVTVYNCTSQLGAVFGELPLTAPSLAAASLVIVNGVTVVSS